LKPRRRTALSRQPKARHEIADFQFASGDGRDRDRGGCSRDARAHRAARPPGSDAEGRASAHLDYRDPSWRVFNVADLLVRDTDLDRFVEVLTTAADPRELPERRRGFDRRFGKDVTVFGPNRVQLDVHRTFAPGAFGLRPRLDDLWLDSTPFVLGGRTARARTRNRLLHACFAATVVDDSPRAVLLREIAQLLSSPGLDADVVIGRATGWRCEPVASAALDIAARVLGALPPSPFDYSVLTHWRTRLRTSERPERVFAAVREVIAATGVRRDGTAIHPNAKAAHGRDSRPGPR
jgi:Uncharacterised nucleotidyltransferase